jgi:hypothetical protein
MTDSSFLSSLIGKPIRVVCKDPVDCGAVPVLTLREVSPLGIVGEGGGDQHFFPWTEVVEISASPGLNEDGELVSAAFADSEP